MLNQIHKDDESLSPVALPFPSGTNQSPFKQKKAEQQSPKKQADQDSGQKQNQLIGKNEIDFGSIYQNMRDVNLQFRQIQRREDKTVHDLEVAHHKFYKSMITSKRDLDQNLENLAIELEYTPEMGRRIKERVKTSDRMPIPLMSLKQSEKDQGVSADSYLKSQQTKTVSFKNDSQQLTAAQNLEKEFEILFTEQRKAVEAANIPLFERMDSDTKKLFTASLKPQAPSSSSLKRRSSSMGPNIKDRFQKMLKDDNVSFAHYVNQMKDPKKVEQVVSLLGERLKHISQDEKEELLLILPKADKNLFFQFRDSQLTFNQLKARVNIKLGLANYKTLDDLIQEGVNPNVKENMQQTEDYLKTIYMKDSLQDITVKEILTREPWQANSQCLKSLFSKVPETARTLKFKDSVNNDKLLSGKELDDFRKQEAPLSLTARVSTVQEPTRMEEDHIEMQKKQISSQSIDVKDGVAVIKKKQEPVGRTREISAYQQIMETKKTMQAMFTRKIKENLTQKIQQQQKRNNHNKIDRSNPEAALYDMNTFCAPFDLNKIDLEMFKRQKNAGKPNQPPIKEIPGPRLQVRGPPSLSSYQSFNAQAQDLAFLKQLIEDGHKVSIDNKDKSMLYEKEIQEKRLLDAALELFPDDGATMLLVGSFSKKVLSGRKPRPQEIIRGKPKPEQSKAKEPQQVKYTLKNEVSHPNLQQPQFFINPTTGMVELKLPASDGTSSPTMPCSEQRLQEVSEKLEEIIGSEEDDNSDNTSRMNPKQQQISEARSPNSMGPETLEYNTVKQKTFSYPSPSLGASQSSPGIRSARRISTLGMANDAFINDQNQKDAIENANSVIQEIELDDNPEKNEEMVLPFRTLERKSSIQPVASKASIIFREQKTPNEVTLETFKPTTPEIQIDRSLPTIQEQEMQVKTQTRSNTTSQNIIFTNSRLQQENVHSKVNDQNSQSPYVVLMNQTADFASGLAGQENVVLNSFNSNSQKSLIKLDLGQCIQEDQALGHGNSNKTLSPKEMAYQRQQSGNQGKQVRPKILDNKAPSIADRAMFRRSRHLANNNKTSINSPRMMTSDHQMSSTNLGSSHASFKTQGVNPPLVLHSQAHRQMDAQTIATYSGVSKNFMSFLGNLGIPCSTSVVVETTMDQQNVNALLHSQAPILPSPSQKRIMSARHQPSNNIILTRDKEQEMNNSTLMYNASQRNSLKDGFVTVDPNPNQQHYQSNRGDGTFRNISPPRQRSPSIKNELRGNSTLNSSRMLSFRQQLEPAVLDPKKYKYVKKGPQQHYHHYPNLYLDGGSSSFPYNPRSGKNPMVIAPQNLTQGFNPSKSLHFRYASTVDI